jgi:hypothetical protein
LDEYCSIYKPWARLNFGFQYSMIVKGHRVQADICCYSLLYDGAWQYDAIPRIYPALRESISMCESLPRAGIFASLGGAFFPYPIRDLFIPRLIMGATCFRYQTQSLPGPQHGMKFLCMRLLLVLNYSTVLYNASQMFQHSDRKASPKNTNGHPHAAPVL